MCKAVNYFAALNIKYITRKIESLSEPANKRNRYNMCLIAEKSSRIHKMEILLSLHLTLFFFLGSQTSRPGDLLEYHPYAGGRMKVFIQEEIKARQDAPAFVNEPYKSSSEINI